jgi:aspartate kinase
MRVLKFGGTSVGTAGRMRNILDIIKDKKDIIVVLSAMSGTTNALVQISEALLRHDKDEASTMIARLEGT